MESPLHRVDVRGAEVPQKPQRTVDTGSCHRACGLAQIQALSTPRRHNCPNGGSRCDRARGHHPDDEPAIAPTRPDTCASVVRREPLRIRGSDRSYSRYAQITELWTLVLLVIWLVNELVS